MERWPNFFIVGAPKAGTTSLYEYLTNIPGIYMSPVKELHFFSKATLPENHPVHPIRDKKKYLSLFHNVKDEKIIGEASPSYLADPEAPKLIHDVSPDAFILISLRDPVERMFSHFLMQIRDGRMNFPFRNELQTAFSKNVDLSKRRMRLELGEYYEPIKRYQNIFGTKRVKIIIFEEFIKHTKQTVEEIIKFVGLNPENLNFNDIPHNPFFEDGDIIRQRIRTSRTLEKFVKRTTTKNMRDIIREKFFINKVKKPKMEEKDRQTLIEYYRADVEKLQKLLGRKPPWKNFVG